MDISEMTFSHDRLFEQVMGQLEEVLLLCDPEGKIFQGNRRASEVTGYTGEELTQMQWADLAAGEDRERVVQEFQRVLEEGNAEFQARLQAKDGRKLPYEFTASLLKPNGDLLICCTGRDISQRQQAERQNALLQLMEKVAAGSNEAESLEEALQGTVNAVCQYTDWPVGHVYVPADNNRDVLEPTGLWNAGSSGRFETFRAVTEQNSFDRGEGLPGRVLSSGNPAWTRDVTKDPNFPRSNLAKNIGVKGAFAFPVQTGLEVVAVLEFFSETSQEPDEEFLETMESVGVQLGRVAEREQSRQSLEASEKRYRALTETAVDAIIVANQQGNIIDWNEGARQIFGYEKEEMLGTSIERIMPQRYRQPHREGMARVNRTGEGKFLGQTIELEGLRKSGEEFPLELSLSSWTVNGERFFASIIRDITERRETEQALRESEEKFRILAERSLMGIVLIQNGSFQYVNPRLAEMLGYRPEQLIGKSAEWLARSEDKAKVRENVRRRLEGEEEAIHYTFRAERRDEKTAYLEVYGTHIQYQGEPTIIGSVLDKTKRRQLEEHILDIQEAERRRLGRELHDSISAQLSGILMVSEGLAYDLEEGRDLAPDDLEQVTRLLRETNQHARQLSQGLSPVTVRGEGLPAALEKLTSNCQQKKAGLSCSVHTEGSWPTVDNQVATHLYRIAQESVNNAIRHGEADHIWIELAATDESLELSVTDDGQGLPPDFSLEQQEGIGMHAMRYRADLIGGRLEITDRPEGGARVSCRILREK